MSVAVIDCGTNSTRLLVVDEHGVTQERHMTITRLGQDVGRTGRLHPEAIERVLQCLASYRVIMDTYAVNEGLVVATSAARDAENGAAFLAECERVTGLSVALLSGTEEAAASYRGATSDLPHDPRTTVIIDIGGGSTELAFYQNNDLVAFSMQLGCVRVSEAHLGTGVILPDARDRALTMIRAEIDRMVEAEPRFLSLVGDVRLVGLAGTVATLAQMDTGTVLYDRNVVHHHIMSRETVRKWSDALAHETAAARLRHPGMVPGREDVLVGGLLILEEVMSRFAIDELLSSECDILDGVAARLREGRDVT